MIIVGICTRPGGLTPDTALTLFPTGTLGSDDVIHCEHGDDHGIAHAYNTILDRAISHPDCQALILVHDDVQVVDGSFRGKILAALSEPQVGIVGPIGGANLTSARWWNARRLAGRVYETRGDISLGSLVADVDVVDGLLLALNRNALEHVRFDEQLTGFHGYDIDICLQARANGLRVVVRPIDVIHRTKTGYGDVDDYLATAAYLSRKWPGQLVPLSYSERLVKKVHTTLQQARRIWGAVRRRGDKLRSRWLSDQLNNNQNETRAPSGSQAPMSSELAEPIPNSPRLCLACGAQLTDSTDPQAQHDGWLIVCNNCGTGRTWPPPSGDATGDELFRGMYSGTRMSRRAIWLAEAKKRLDWVELYVPEGTILEVGSATGEFLIQAQAAGYSAYGIEPSTWAADRARDSGVLAYPGDLASWRATFPDFRVDAVCMWHVLEHVDDPFQLLRHSWSVLVQDGCLVLEVPNFDCDDARAFGAHWVGALPSDHVSQFTPVGLCILLERAGFIVEHVIAFTAKPYASLDSWRSLRNADHLRHQSAPSREYVRVVAWRSSGDQSAG